MAAAQTDADGNVPSAPLTARGRTLGANQSQAPVSLGKPDGGVPPAGTTGCKLSPTVCLFHFEDV